MSLHDSQRQLCSNVVDRVITRKLHLSNYRPKQCRPSSLHMNLHTRNPSSRSTKPRLEKSRLAYMSSPRFFATSARLITSSQMFTQSPWIPRSRRGGGAINRIRVSAKSRRGAACLGVIIVIVVVLIAVQGPFSTRPAQHGADISPRFYGCVIIDDSYYGNLMTLVYCSLLFSYDTHQLRSDLSEAVGVRSQHLVTVANDSDQ